MATMPVVLSDQLGLIAYDDPMTWYRKYGADNLESDETQEYQSQVDRLFEDWLGGCIEGTKFLSDTDRINALHTMIQKCMGELRYEVINYDTSGHVLIDSSEDLS